MTDIAAEIKEAKADKDLSSEDLEAEEKEIKGEIDRQNKLVKEFKDRVAKIKTENEEAFKAREEHAKKEAAIK